MSNRRTFTSLCRGADPEAFTGTVGGKPHRRAIETMCRRVGLLGISATASLVAFVHPSAQAQTYALDKIYAIEGKGTAVHAYNFIDGFYDAPLVLGTGASTTLWFTALKGGLDDEGELVKFSLATKNLTVMNLSFGGASENPAGSGNFTNDPAGPEASPVYDNGDGTKNYLYFTTVGGGIAGNATVGGTLVRYDMDTNTYAKLWDAPAAGGDGGRQPRGTVAIVDRGGDGKDIYFSNSGGGAGSSTTAGGIMRYNTKSGVTTKVIDFEGPPGGGSPYDGFVRVGNKLYLTTFTGGDTTANANGSGTLSSIDITDPANPVYEVLKAMPGGSTSGTGSSTRLPTSTPIYDAATNSLYFTTVGSTGNPGAIMKFSLSVPTTDPLSLQTLYAYPSGPTSGANAEGRNGGYNSPYLYNGFIYTISRAGGANNLGTINQYDLSTGTLRVLYDLTSENGGGLGDFAFSDFDYNNDGIPDPALYFVTSGSSTTDGTGSVMRLSLTATIPEPGSAVLGLVGAACLLNARRRKSAQS